MVLSTQIARIDGMYLGAKSMASSANLFIGLMLAASIDDEQVHLYLRTSFQQRDIE